MKNILAMLKDQLAQQKNMTPKQQAVLQAAIALFAEKGFTATSTSEIAKKAGVAEGTVFKHFQTKEKLLFSAILPILVEDVFPEAIQKFKQDVLDQKYPDFETFISHFVDDRFSFAQDNKKMIKILFQESMYRNELKKAFEYVLKNHAMKVFQPILASFKKQKMIVNWPDDKILRTIFTNLFGFIVIRFFISPDRHWDDQKELYYVKQSIIKALKI